MLKKVMGLLAVFLSVLILWGCDSADKMVVIEKNCSVGVKQNSVEYVAAVNYCNINNVQLVPYNSYYDAVLSFENQKNSGLIINDLDNKHLSEKLIKASKFEQIDGESKYCAYFNLNDVELCNEIKNEIDEMYVDGTMSKLISDYKSKGDFRTEQNNENGFLTILAAPVFENRFLRTDNGDYSGIDYIILENLMSRLGYGFEIKTTEFEDLFNSLEKGEGNLIFSATEYTDERAERFLTVNYLDVHYYLYKNK